ncbi:MAG: HAMP domain-containing histidine kinase [Bacteroidales bacterium]|nr:HAMP domain-containing histidine kinase [Bacteroidales bacterium]
MTHRTLLSIIIVAAISLLGIFLTQTYWLRKTLNVTQRQFDHRANQMLSDVVAEMKTFADTSVHIIGHVENNNLELFDVIDTILLRSLVQKYSDYHQLGNEFAYALVVTPTNEIVYTANGFEARFEEPAYKLCLSCLWHKEYIHLSVYYFQRGRNIAGEFIVWMVLSAFFIVTASASFIIVVFNFYQQKKLAEIKNDFINNMTHELKTPISTISVTSEILINAYKQDKNDRMARYPKIIFEENQRMRKLVEKVLNISSMERGQIKIEKEEFDMHKLIYKAVEVYCVEACTKNVRLDYDFLAQNAHVFADPMHLRNILNNLVDNAVKYSGENTSMKITTKNTGDYFMFSVSDNGIGIPKEALGKVYEKFYRVPSGNVHNVKGFGLGLFYVKTMVDAHNGKIEISSTINKGTTVSIFLPQQTFYNTYV